MMQRMTAAYAVAAAVSLAATGAALAHHGWSWAEGEQTELEGTIAEISMAPPHPSLKVEAFDGVVWQVDLGNPRNTERSGFVEGSAKVGDPIVVLGNRSLDKDEKLMKAVRITVAGKAFDIYPERIETN